MAWTLHCTGWPSAVKHNAMRLHHSHVWGYRWPAVCLCSSPLGQLEPSIRPPPPPPPHPWALSCPSARSVQHHPDNIRLSHLVCGTSGGHFSTSTNMNVFLKCILCLSPVFLDKLKSHLAFLECCNCFFESCIFIGGFVILLHSPSHHLGRSLAINWYIVELTPCSTCSHRPFSLCRWKALKPIIVLLEGRLPPWTLWHTFKESGPNVFRPDSQWLWH